MLPVDRFEFSLTSKIQFESMMGASKFLLKGRNAFLYLVICNVMTILSGVGGIGIVLILADLGRFDPAPWGVLSGLILGSGFYFYGSYLLYKSLANIISKRAFSKTSKYIIFDETGMIYGAGTAVWSTPWSLIDSVVETKKTVAIIISGIAFGLPKTAIGDATIVACLVKDLTKKIKKARLD